MNKLFNKFFSNTFNSYNSNPSLNDSSLSFFYASPIPNLLLDTKGTVVHINDAFIKMIGSKKYAEPGWSFDQIVKKTQHELLNATINNAISNINNNKPIEIKIISKHKLIAFIFITKLTLNNSDYLIVHLIDITEHKKLEIGSAHSQKMQALGELAGGIAHDFNNLLTAMLGFSDLLLLRHFEGDPSFAGITQIKKNINRAISLVRQLLAFSKKQVLNIQLINVNEVLSELAHLINRLIYDNISLEMKYNKNLRNVSVDKGQLEQVIINLAVNARDAMPNGGTLTITTENINGEEYNRLHKTLITPCTNDCCKNDEYVLITVSDTGTGIPKKLINKIFEPFFSTKKIGTGTGLGLSTVYGIVKQTGGCLFLETQENIGTKFYILLKAYKENPDSISEIPKENRLLADENSNTELSGSGTVLIVEDEESVRTVINYALKDKGYTILEANDGTEALEIVKQKNGKIDIIITDVIMPQISGPDLITAIHKLYPEVKVIFISGYTDHPFINMIPKNDKIHFLPKPFSIKELSLKAKEVLMI